ncbi:hypothetical protein QYE76_024442 [Lolium multiflorum]|uniref:CCHC-type domain-containing protein n=1 Tax=Lolium multiflorum TaxID=4521 RepID=A0AAD8RDP5_LOLMU|nr:hypothetical protein QYE76_024442 [Lolium multiflorum]
MSGHAKKLNDLGIVIPNQLGIHRVLQSLPPSYKNFVINYNMQNMNKELPELFSMLKSAEVEIQKEHQVLMVSKTTSFKKQGKPNNKDNFKKGGKKAVAPPKKPKAGPKPDTVCFYCKEEWHWKRNCPKYLADLKRGHVKKKEHFEPFALCFLAAVGRRQSAAPDKVATLPPLRRSFSPRGVPAAFLLRCYFELPPADFALLRRRSLSMATGSPFLW